ncbi:cyclic lactone autoinducer peptide [Paenibacillus odorifer]|nr:cyclic lactone autoinducer peptide [Paenibacillus odorifer]
MKKNKIMILFGTLLSGIALFSATSASWTWIHGEKVPNELSKN